MIEATGNLWTYPADWRIVTTNGFIKKDGTCVMGRGCALEYAKQNPVFPKLLGDAIKANGNHVYNWPELKILTFPVKHNWFEKADIDLIKQSVDELNNIIFGQLDETSIVMPRPGCGNGKLNWNDVKPLLEKLPDNVTVITFDS